MHTNVRAWVAQYITRLIETSTVVQYTQYTYVYTHTHTHTHTHTQASHSNAYGLRVPIVLVLYTYMYALEWTEHTQSVQPDPFKTCIGNRDNIFAGFWIRACWICAKYAKINVPRIFPLYSITHTLYHMLCKFSFVYSDNHWGVL